jgi:hypothetical protein
MEQEKRFICVYLCSSVEKICPNLFCADLERRLSIPPMGLFLRRGSGG